MSWNVMIVAGIDLLWDLRIDLRCQRGLRMSYRMQTGALKLVTMSWIYHQTCSGGATWGKAAVHGGILVLYIYYFGPFPLANQISRKALEHGGRFNSKYYSEWNRRKWKEIETKRNW